MPKEELSLEERLEETQKRLGTMVLRHVELEAQVLILDQIVGFLLQTGQRPPPEVVTVYRSIILEKLKAKYPGVHFTQEVARPSLYLPGNGVSPN